MRHARTDRRRPAVPNRAATLTLLALVNGLAGCTHNYYYGAGANPCATGGVGVVATGVAPFGAVCRAPTQVIGGSTVVAGQSLPESPASGGARPPRVVLSENPSGSRGSSWRGVDADGGLPTTTVQGAVDDPTVVR